MPGTATAAHGGRRRRSRTDQEHDRPDARRCVIEPPGTLERSVGKARRVVDQRPAIGALAAPGQSIILITAGTWHSRWVASSVTNGVDDDLGFSRLVEDQIRMGCRREAADAGVVRAGTNVRIAWQEFDEGADTRLNPASIMRRVGLNKVKNCAQIGQGRASIAQLQRPCLSHTACTCPSVTKSPREAAAFEAAMAARSAGESTTAGQSSSAPASRRTTRAISSCASAGRLRAIPRARSSSSVISVPYHRPDGPPNCTLFRAAKPGRRSVRPSRPGRIPARPGWSGRRSRR